MTARKSKEAYAGIDLAIAKKKRLPVVVVVCHAGRLEPLALNARDAPKPPCGCGNALIVDVENRRRLAFETVTYIRRVEKYFDVHIGRIAIDAPGAPRRDSDTSPFRRSHSPSVV